MEQRTCRECGEKKPVVEFHKSRISKGGRNTICKGCRANHERERYMEKRNDGCIRCGGEPVTGHVLCDLCWMEGIAKRRKAPIGELMSTWRDECPYTKESLAPYNAVWRGEWVSKKVGLLLDRADWDELKEIVERRLDAEKSLQDND